MWGSASGGAAPAGSRESGRGGRLQQEVAAAWHAWWLIGLLVGLVWVRLPVKAVLRLCPELLMPAPKGVISLVKASM